MQRVWTMGRAVALAVVALALSWRLVVSVAGVAHEFACADSRGRTLGERLAAIDEPLAARRHRSLGFAAGILDAVVAGVPDDGVLLVVCDATSRNELLGMVVVDLLWPRRILSPEAFAAAANAPAAIPRARLFALTVAGARLPDPQEWERLSGTPRFALWRAKGSHP